MDTQDNTAAPAETVAPVANDPGTVAALPPGKVFVSFVYITKDGNGAPVQRQARTFLMGTLELFLQQKVEDVEAMIADTLKVDQPQIVFWKALVA